MQAENIIVQFLTAQMPDLRAIYLFGSHATGEAGVDSDFDIAILTGKPQPAPALFDLSTELANLLGSDVDLVELGTASTVMRSQVVSTGRRLYASSETDQEAFEDFVYSDYARLNEERAGILNDIHERGSIHG